MKTKFVNILFYLFFLLLILLSCSKGCSTTKPSNQHFEDYDELSYDFDYKKVKMVRVDSSAIEYIGYDDYNEKLLIVFKPNNDRLYIYDSIDYGLYDDLINAESIGGYYNDYIKGAYYNERIDSITVRDGYIVDN